MLYLFPNDDRSKAIYTKLDFIQNVSDDNPYEVQMNKVVCNTILRDDIHTLRHLKKEGYTGWNEFHLQLVCCTGNLELFIFLTEVCGIQVQPLLHLSYAAERNFIEILRYAYSNFCIDSSWNTLFAYARQRKQKVAEDFCLKCAIETIHSDADVDNLNQLIENCLTIDMKSISI